MLISALWQNDSVIHMYGFPGGSDSNESACSAGDPDLVPGLEKGMATHSTILAGTCRVIVPGVAKSQT